MTARLGDEVSAAVSVFRRPAAPADRLTPAVRASTSLAPPWAQLDEASSRAVRLDDGRSVFVLGGEDCLGLYELNGSGGIFALSSVLAGEAMQTAFAGTGRLRVTAVVPDVFTEAAVTTRGGRKLPAAIHDNVLDLLVTFATASPLPATLELRGPKASSDTPVPGASEELLSMRSPAELPPL